MTLRRFWKLRYMIRRMISPIKMKPSSTSYNTMLLYMRSTRTIMLPRPSMPDKSSASFQRPAIPGGGCDDSVWGTPLLADVALSDEVAAAAVAFILLRARYGSR